MTTSTINPAIPATNAPVASSPVRGNFQAAYNDVNALWAAIAAGLGVSSVNTLTGAVVFAAGSNVTLTPVGNTITIAATGGGGGGGTGHIITATGAITLNPAFFITQIAQTVPAASAVSVDPATLTPWTAYTVKDGANNAGAYNITITPASGTFDSQANYVIFQNNGSVTFYSDGTNIWVYQ